MCPSCVIVGSGTCARRARACTRRTRATAAGAGCSPARRAVLPARVPGMSGAPPGMRATSCRSRPRECVRRCRHRGSSACRDCACRPRTPADPAPTPGALPVIPTCATFAADEPPHAEASTDSPTTAANPSVRCSTVARPAASRDAGAGHFPESFEKRLLASLVDSLLRQAFAAAMKLGEFGS
jgi:hypothetical protein